MDAEYHLIVAHEVVNEGNDRAQLAPMGRQAQAAIDAAEITVLADRGYMNGEQVLECEGTGILPCVPRTDTSGKAQRGLFTKADFVYDADHDRYTCPAEEHLTKARAFRPSRRRGQLPQLERLPRLRTATTLHD